MSYNINIQIPFKWYDSIAEQNRNKSVCKSDIPFELITPKDRLLPFILRKEHSESTGLTITIYNESGSVAYPVNPQILEVYQDGDVDIIFYYGAIISGLTMACGNYYAAICDGLNTYYSEIFAVKDFQVSNPPYLKLEWKNSSNISDIIYQTGYVNRLFLDTDLLEPDPQDISEEGFESQVGIFIPSFRRTVKRYKAVAPKVPGYIVDALQVAQLNDTIDVQKGTTLFESVFDWKSKIDWLFSSCYANVEFTFKSNQILVGGNTGSKNLTVKAVTNPVVLSIQDVIYSTDAMTCDGVVTLYADVAEGYGMPQFSNDGITWSNDNIFSGLCVGQHIFYAKVPGCNAISSLTWDNALVNCSDFSCSTLQDLIDANITLGQIINCKLLDFLCQETGAAKTGGELYFNKITSIVFGKYEIGDKVPIKLANGSYIEPVLYHKTTDAIGSYFYFTPAIVVANQNVTVYY